MQPHRVDWRNSPEDLNNLISKTNVELYELYWWMSHDVIRRTANKYRTNARKVAAMEDHPEQAHDPNLDKLAALFERSGIDPSDIQNLRRVNVWQGFYKDEDGEAQTVDMISAQYIPKAKEMTEDDYIRQAAPVHIHPSKGRARRSTGLKTAIILPDIQAGFRQYEDGRLDPTHDPQALDIALQIIRDTKPDQVILNGDNLDLPQFGRYSQENSLGGTLNKTLDYVHQLLAQIRANSPDSTITYLAGNHELRLQKYLMQYAERLYGVRQGGTGDRILTVPFLLNLAGLDIQYKSGYPANHYWINERLKAIHGNVARPAGQTAPHYARIEETSTVFGHVHRREFAARTAVHHKSARYIIAQSFGCLARIDGAVPSYGSGYDEVTDEPIKRWENWQHGLGFVEYTDGDTPFETQQIDIQTFNGYETRFNGKIYAPIR